MELFVLFCFVLILNIHSLEIHQMAQENSVSKFGEAGAGNKLGVVTNWTNEKKGLTPD